MWIKLHGSFIGRFCSSRSAVSSRVGKQEKLPEDHDERVQLHLSSPEVDVQYTYSMLSMRSCTLVECRTHSRKNHTAYIIVCLHVYSTVHMFMVFTGYVRLCGHAHGIPRLRNLEKRWPFPEELSSYKASSSNFDTDPYLLYSVVMNACFGSSTDQITRDHRWSYVVGACSCFTICIRFVCLGYQVYVLRIKFPVVWRPSSNAWRVSHPSSNVCNWTLQIGVFWNCWSVWSSFVHTFQRCSVVAGWICWSLESWRVFHMQRIWHSIVCRISCLPSKTSSSHTCQLPPWLCHP